MTDASPNHAYKVGHAAGRAAGIRAAMTAIASLPTGKSEDVMEGQEQAYRAVEDLLLSLADGPSALPAVTPAVKVKPLVWDFHPVNPQTGFLPYDIAPGIGGSYLIEHCRGNGGEFDMWLPNQVNGTRFDTREAAKAAAQADYEARVLSALDVTPAPSLAEALELPEVKALVEAVDGLIGVLNKHETKGPLPDEALMFCWLAAQEVRAVRRKMAEAQA